MTPTIKSGREQKREALKAKIALARLKQNTDAIERIVEILGELPDWEMRKSVIDYLHRQLSIVEESHAPR